MNDAYQPGRLDRQQEFGDVERSARAAQPVDVAGPFAPLFCIIGERTFNLFGDLRR